MVQQRPTLFGDKDYQTVKEEPKANLPERGYIDMLSWKDLIWDIRKQALGYLMFLKRKQSEKMKGRGCANERRQQECITKEESSSPTMSVYALMGSCVMDALDDRKVITVNITSFFLQGNWPQDKHPGYIMF